MIHRNGPTYRNPGYLHLPGPRLLDLLRQIFSTLRAAEQMHRLLPAGELFLRQNDDIALAALPSHHQRVPAVSHLVTVATQMPTQIGKVDGTHRGSLARAHII